MARSGGKSGAAAKAKVPTPVAEVSKKDKALEERLLAACKRGELSELRALLAAGCELVPQALQEACRNGHLAVVQALVEAGADIEAEAETGSALIVTIWADKLKVFRYLIDIGANVNTKHARLGISAFAFAAHEGKLEMMEILLEHGADFRVDAPLKYAMCKIEIVQFLIDLGCDPLDATPDGGTILHAAAGRGRPRLMVLLLDRGYDVNALDDRGWTPLHQTCYAPEHVVDKIALLLSRGAKDALAVESKAGYCPLHLILLKGDEELAKARMHSKADLVGRLLDAGADANAKCRNGRSALDLAVFENDQPNDDVLTVVRLLCSHGAVWDASCEKSFGRELADKPKPKEKKKDRVTEKLEKYAKYKSSSSGGSDAEEREVTETSEEFLKWVGGIRACVQHWQTERTDKGSDALLTEIPMEVIQLGEHSVKLYISDQTSSTDDQKIARSKICVVGPSEWGKTSLVKSVTSMQPSLVHIEDRTIGIDLFPCAFEESIGDHNSRKSHEVTFWDFAGQDVYHVAHALFFSKRTLYLLCIDLPQYIEQLKNLHKLSIREHESAMNRFVNHHVLRWVEMIIVRQPDAEFLVVATKEDLVENKTAIEEVRIDLKARQHSWRASFAENATASIQVDGASSPQGRGTHAADQFRLQEIMEKLERTFRDSWIVASSVDQASVELARKAVERSVVASSKGFVMGKKYNGVVQAIAKRRQAAAVSGDPKTRVESLILPVNYLCRQLLNEIEDLEVEDCALILRTLHELGDILWYDHRGAEALRDCVILDPVLVIDLVKEVISHEHQVEPGAQDEHVDKLWRVLRDEGRMSHELLRSGKLWHHLDEELTQAFKSLLKYFKLAYSAEGDAMDWDSDLIVPAYWKIKSVDASSSGSASEMSVLQFGQIGPSMSIAWEYGVSAGVAGTVFDHFAVQSYSAQIKRTVTSHSIECCESGDFASRILLVSDEATRDAIRIEVVSTDRENAWRNLRYFVMMMEKVLEEYPGLLVSREIISIDKQTRKETHHRVASIVNMLEDAAEMGRDVGKLYASWPWLSPDFSWFIEKAWRHPGILHEIQARALVRQMVDKTTVLQKLIARGNRGRVLPALWSARYDKSTGSVQLEMLSDLSGVCFHEPLDITGPQDVLATHGIKMEAGLWICSNVVPEMLTLGVIQKVIDTAAPLLSSRIERAQAVHSLFNMSAVAKASDCGFPPAVNEAASLSPAGARALLRDLLKLHDPNFDELRISELAKLQCAVSATGSYVWAHPSEIKAMSEHLTPCDPDNVHAASRNVAPPASTGATKSELVRVKLTFDRLDGLSSWDSYKVLCTWQLYHSSSSSPLATGTTEPVTPDSSSVSWHDRPFLLSCVTSVVLLRECRFDITVKRASRFLGQLKRLGEVSVPLADFIPEFSEPGAAMAISLVLPLDAEASRVLKCTLTPSRAVAGG